jgi:hypothetical protein
VQCAVARLLVLRAKAEVTQRRGASSRSGRPGSAPGALWRGMDVSWACLGACVLTSLVPVFVGAVAGRVQESEERLVDTVVQAGGGQVKRWHEGGLAMPRHGQPWSMSSNRGGGKW